MSTIGATARGATGAALEVPDHFTIARAEGIRVDENETAEFAGFAAAINAVEHTHDFVVGRYAGQRHLSDAPCAFDGGHAGDAAQRQLPRLRCARHGGSCELRGDRGQSLRQDGAPCAAPAPHRGWRVDRLDRGAQPLALLNSRNKKQVGECLHSLGLRLGFRAAEGFSERVVYREFFPHGLTALDELDEKTLGTRPNLSHATARQEVRALIDALKLPIDERGRRRAAARAEWALRPTGRSTSTT